MISKESFLAIEGFDENLPIHGQDIDLCLKLQKYGKINWVLPYITGLHKESASRTLLDLKISKEEVRYMYKKWGKYLECNPFYSESFSKFSETPILSPNFLKKWTYPWSKVLKD
jgi:GT2 family glycosyltransferase